MVDEDYMTEATLGMKAGRREPVAVVGLGCRLPGASNPAALWDLLCAGRDAITDFPADRWETEEYYDPRPGTPGKSMTRWGGFLDDVRGFDAAFFGISPREAMKLDPQQRLLLEITWEALEDACIPPHTLTGSSTGVFVGTSANEYLDGSVLPVEEIDLHTITGRALSLISGRLSYILGLTGPALTIDTACSSSLMACHLALQSIWAGESTSAIVAGVNLLLLPRTFVGFSRGGMMAADGRCKFGDASADGYVRAEGAGVVILKPLAQARADGNRIYAILRGSAANNDGRASDRLLTPAIEGQVAVLEAAYRDAQINPATIGYVEAHGTGTAVGDPIEVAALARVLGRDRQPASPLYVGSIKTNIGHAEGAAGVAGLIKAALVAEHGYVPPSLHCTTPNPAIPWETIPVRIAREGLQLPVQEGSPSRVGVNSFGISGTNVHVILDAVAKAPKPAHDVGGPLVLPLSARSDNALRDLATAYRALTADASPSELPAICSAAATGRSHLEHRLCVVGRTGEEIASGLDGYLDDPTRPSLRAPERGPVFVFSGQGSQWEGMGLDLMEREPVFRAEMEACGDAIKRLAGWSLLHELAAEPGNSRLDDNAVLQPAILAIQLSLAALWRSWGIEPAAVVGYSMGEVAAACVAGALSRDDAIRIITSRGEIMQRLAGTGGVLMAQLSEEAANAAIQELSEEMRADVQVAILLGPSSTVFSGRRDTVLRLKDLLDQKDIFCRLVRMDVASHSPEVDSILADLASAIADITPGPVAIPMRSTVTRQAVAGEELAAAYWANNLRSMVAFQPVIGDLLSEGYGAFIEIGPAATLVGALGQIARVTEIPSTVVASMRRNDDAATSLLGGLAALYTRGFDVDWRAVYPSGPSGARLPSYPWQHQRFWIDQSIRPPETSRADGTGFLGHRVPLALKGNVEVWRSEISVRRFPLLADHRVNGRAVFPGAGYLDMATALGEATFGGDAFAIEDVVFDRIRIVPETEAIELQTLVTREGADVIRFEIHALDAAADGPTLHCRGVVRRVADAPPPIVVSPDVADFEFQITGEQHVAWSAEGGFDYGPAFDIIDRIGVTGDRDAYALLRPLASGSSERYGFAFDPRLIDCCLQIAWYALPPERRHDTDLRFPVGVGHWRIHGPLPRSGQLSVLIREHAVGDEGSTTFTIDELLLDADGRVFTEMRGIMVQAVAAEPESPLDGLAYVDTWAPSAAPVALPLPTEASWLVIAEDGARARALQKALSGREPERVVLGADHLDLTSNPVMARLENPDDVRQALDHIGVGAGELRVILVLDQGESAGLDGPIDALLDAQCRAYAATLHVTQALLAHPEIEAQIAVITRSAHSIHEAAPNLAHGPLAGLLRTLRLEHPELGIRQLDIDGGDQSWDAVLDELRAWPDDRETAFRGGEHFVRRVRHLTDRDIAQSLTRRRAVAESENYALEVGEPGSLHSLELVPTERRVPGEGEVEIRVTASGINFRDVLSAHGILPGYPRGAAPLGYECAGIVTALGQGVHDFAVGERVLALGRSTMARYTVVKTALTVAVPPSLTDEQAAGLPIAYLTGLYALEHLAHIEAGERVLIHAATGGVGLAAVQIAQAAGAEIFATCGSDEKRALLARLGVRHIMNSRTSDFAAEIMAVTDGQGVDIVLNSLTGPFIPLSLGVLGPYGRFLELGRRDIYEDAPIGLAPFKHNLSFFGVDLDRLADERPHVVRRLLHTLVARLTEGSLGPLPVTASPLADAEEAFRTMAQARHTGKLVLSVGAEAVEVVETRAAPPIRADGCYVLSGGTGGLGLQVARYLTERGARHLALLSRRGETPEVTAALHDLRADGVCIRVAAVDVCDEAELTALLEEIRREGPPIRGIFHLAGILDDGIIEYQTVERFARVAEPKMRGAFLLHHLTGEDPLEHFVLFSTLGAFTGSTSQANYAAANAGMASLAAARRAHGLPALSIDWGPWAEVGMAAQGTFAADLGGSVTHLSVARSLAALDALLSTGCTRVAVARMDVSTWFARSHGTEVAGARPGGSLDEPTREELDLLDPAERLTTLVAWLAAQTGTILGLDGPAESARPLISQGLDSLMAVELRARVASVLGVHLAVPLILDGASVESLAVEMLHGWQMTVSQDGSSGPAGGDVDLLDPASAEALLAEVDNLSDEEVDRLLKQVAGREW